MDIGISWDFYEATQALTYRHDFSLFDSSSAAVISLSFVRLHPSDFGFSQSVGIQFCVGPQLPSTCQNLALVYFPGKSEILLLLISFLHRL